MTVGAFAIFAGADAQLGAGANGLGFGVGSSSTATRKTLRQDGNEFACASSTPTDLKPPENCGAPIRVELALLAASDSRPSCPNGMRWDGSACIPLSPVRSSQLDRNLDQDYSRCDAELAGCK